ncbi:hypothetical protein ACN38_g12063 [Penicillium nordicum]|uniref:Uncharacterized protein n=1 Tax=Penicillium nordicum TaxID=229535 RepID=A0A0M9WA72_9EURO|nr:hypothetical protein ACN38_g12063 [Penicillium nordicum]
MGLVRRLANWAGPTRLVSTPVCRAGESKPKQVRQGNAPRSGLPLFFFWLQAYDTKDTTQVLGETSEVSPPVRALTTTSFYSVQTDQYNSLLFWTKLAQLLDKAGFHAMVIANTLGAYRCVQGPGSVVAALASGAQFPVNGPFCTLFPPCPLSRETSFLE